MTTNLLHNNASLFLILALSILLLPIGFMFINLARRRQRRQGWPPHPWRLPIIGNLHQLTRLPHRGFHYLSKKYGPLMVVYFGSTPCFVMSSSDMVREMIKTHDVIFSNRPKTKASRMLFNGSDDLVFSYNTDFWRGARKLCVNEMLSIKQVESSRFIVEEEVGELVAKIRSTCLNDSSSAIDLGDLFRTLSTNIIFRAVLGRKCTDEAMRHLGKQAGELLSCFSFGDFSPLLSWLDTLTGFNRKGMRLSRALHAFLDRVVDEHETDADGQNDSKGFIVQIINPPDKSGQSFTRGNIKAILLDMLIGGTDTTASLMEWTMAELVRQPRIMKKVQDEIRSIIGTQQRICQHDVKRMEYLQCVVKESLRLHSPSATCRQSSADALIGGFKVPKKSIAIVNSWSIHRDPLTWDSPLEFLPERFLSLTSPDYSGQDYKYVPFGVGRRICPGAHFAVSEAEYALANLLFCFNCELPNGTTAEDLNMSETASQAGLKKISLCLVPATIQPSLFM